MKKKIFVMPVLISLLCVVCAGCITREEYQPPLTVEQLYERACDDAMIAEADEILPLVAITAGEPLVQWDAAGERVLVCTWHRYPDSYPDGEEIVTSFGVSWVFTLAEIVSWHTEEPAIEDYVLRLEQLIGLPPENGKTLFTAMWVRPEDLFRPSYDNEIDDDTVGLYFPSDVDPEYRSWFQSNLLSSYYPEQPGWVRYPWTRLGYTYDWADNGTEYGLSEFIVKENSSVRVEKTYSNEEFFLYLQEESAKAVQ